MVRNITDDNRYFMWLGGGLLVFAAILSVTSIILEDAVTSRIISSTSLLIAIGVFIVVLYLGKNDKKEIMGGIQNNRIKILGIKRELIGIKSELTGINDTLLRIERLLSKGG